MRSGLSSGEHTPIQLRLHSSGRGTAVDAAKFFRETEATPADLEKYGISLGEATAAKGLALSKLSEPIFKKVVQGDLPLGQAVAIGEGTADHAEQAAILKQIERREKTGREGHGGPHTGVHPTLKRQRESI